MTRKTLIQSFWKQKDVIKAGIILAIYGSAAEVFTQTECKRKGSAHILSGRPSTLCLEIQLVWPVMHSSEYIPLAKPACKG